MDGKAQAQMTWACRLRDIGDGLTRVVFVTAVEGVPSRTLTLSTLTEELNDMYAQASERRSARAKKPRAKKRPSEEAPERRSARPPQPPLPRFARSA
jgi:hypothetical protein